MPLMRDVKHTRRSNSRTMTIGVKMKQPEENMERKATVHPLPCYRHDLPGLQSHVHPYAHAVSRLELPEQHLCSTP